MPDSLPTHDENFDAAAFNADPARKDDAHRVTHAVLLSASLTQVDYLDPPARLDG